MEERRKSGWTERTTPRGRESEGLELEDESGETRLVEEGGVIVRTGWNIIKDRLDMFRCENDSVCLMGGRRETERKLRCTRCG